MANRKQLSILKKGVQVWNQWRDENPTVRVDLSNTKEGEFDGLSLFGVNFSNAILDHAQLNGINLSSANLSKVRSYAVNLIGAVLTNANLNEAILSSAKLIGTVLTSASLREARLPGVDLRTAYLEQADFYKADLFQADLSGAKLFQTNFSYANFSSTVLGKTDLSKAIGLENAIHKSASTLGVDTLRFSQGKIPEVFLSGCGLSNWEIEATKLYDPNLTNQEMDELLYKVHDIRAHQSIQISPLFISYSHADGEFVDRMEKSLNKKGVRFWRDIHHSTSGPLEKQIDRAIAQNPTVLVVLSENSTKSDWVQHEVRKAREIEKDVGRHVLCPVRLDDTFFSSPWPERIKEQVMEYNILDFSKWEDNENFEKTFNRLIDGLNLFYKKEDE